MKKATILLMGLFLVMSLTACGKKDDTQNGGTQETGTEQTGTEQTGTEQTGTEQTEEGSDVYKDASMEDLKAAVVEVLGEDYWPNTAVEAEMFSDMTGVTADMYDEFFAEMPMISTNVDTMMIVKAKEGQVETVEEMLNAYRDRMVGDTMQYPMNVGKIQASRIEVYGNYVCFVQLGADVSAAMEQGDDAVIAQCQEENEKALDAIRTALLQ